MATLLWALSRPGARPPPSFPGCRLLAVPSFPWPACACPCAVCPPPEMRPDSLSLLPALSWSFPPSLHTVWAKVLALPLGQAPLRLQHLLLSCLLGALSFLLLEKDASPRCHSATLLLNE